MLLSETIVAPAIALNMPSAIGILRVSGDRAFQIMSSLFKKKNKAPFFNDIDSIKPRYMYHGYLAYSKDSDSIVDEIMICFYKAPYSYTGEDMVEIFSHGGAYNMQSILKSVISSGARAAEAGEFTKRACINGKMDLCQAEAILDVINSKTRPLHDIAISQVKGILSNEINQIKMILLEIIAEIEANLDFPEDDIAPLNLDSIDERLRGALAKTKKMIETYEFGKVIRSGVRLIIVGSPNVGKSSLFNLLLREERAIVTAIPGTTRDILEETVNINGIPFSLVDTAGLRQTPDVIEKIGMERAIKHARKSDIAIIILDSSRVVTNDDVEVLEHVKNIPKILVINKIDEKSAEFDSSLEKLGFLNVEKDFIIEVSVKENLHIDSLKNLIAKKSGIDCHHFESSDNVITNARHAAALKRAESSLNDAVLCGADRNPVDLLTIDIRGALSALGEIVGETLTDDILHKIFEKFCIGK